jgi:alanyl-tRNA synthetase
LNQFESIAAILKNPKDVVKSVEDLVSKNNILQKEIEILQKKELKQLKNSFKSKIVEKNGIHLFTAVLDLDAGQVKDLCFQLKAEVQNLVCIVGSKADDKAALTIAISDNLCKEKDWNAGTIVREAAKLIQGGGGGQPNFATAGGRNVAGLQAAVEQTMSLLGL